jgi:hypothetical protein
MRWPLPSCAGQAAANSVFISIRRHPERTLLYQTIAEHFETWFELASAGQFDGQGDQHTPKPHVRQAFRKYLECGIFAHGFARAWCDDCGHDYFVAYMSEGAPGVVPLGHASPPTPESAPPKRSPAHYLWAVLIARIYEVFPLLCPMCGGQMRLIAFITEGMQIRRILDHIGVDSEPPHISPARGPPLWDDCDAHVGEGVAAEPDWDLAAQAAPDFEVDQRINW